MGHYSEVWDTNDHKNTFAGQTIIDQPQTVKSAFSIRTKLVLLHKATKTDRTDTQLSQHDVALKNLNLNMCKEFNFGGFCPPHML